MGPLVACNEETHRLERPLMSWYDALPSPCGISGCFMCRECFADRGTCTHGYTARASDTPSEDSSEADSVESDDTYNPLSCLNSSDSEYSE